MFFYIKKHTPGRECFSIFNFLHMKDNMWNDNKQNHQSFKFFSDVDFENWKIVLNDFENLKKLWISYARVSTEEQAKKGFGIDSQISTNCIFAENENIKIIKEFKDEGISGGKLNRKWINDALNFARKRNENLENKQKLQYLIVTESSRISRSDSLLETLQLINKIQKETGLEILYSTQNNDKSTPEAEMYQNLNYVFASLSRSLTRTRNINTNKSKMYKWKRPRAVPLWYLPKYLNQDWERKNRILIKNEETAPIIKQALELFANGTFDYKYDIIWFLNKNNIETIRKKQVHKSYLDRLLSFNKIMFYAGFLVRPERGINDFIKGEHEPLIDLETAKKILWKLEKKTRKKTKSLSLYKQNKEIFPFKGFLYCPCCDSVMSAGVTTNRKKKEYWYYYCFNEKCDFYKKSFNSEKLEELFIKYLSKFKLKNHFKEIVDLMLLKKQISNENRARENLKNVNERKKELENEMEKLEEKILNIKSEKLQEKFEEQWSILNEEKENLEQKLDWKQLFEKSHKELKEKISLLFSDPGFLFKNSSYESKRILIKLFAPKCFIMKKRFFCKPLKMLIK